MPNPISLQGIPAAPGLAKGHIYKVATQSLSVPRYQAEDKQSELGRLQVATGEAKKELAEFKQKIKDANASSEAEIFEAHLMILEDDALTSTAFEHIENQVNAEAAWVDAVEFFAKQLESIPDPTIAGRALDVRDVGQRVLKHLMGMDTGGIELSKPSVLVGRDLTPSDTVNLDKRLALGFLTAQGGPTSHTAILARSLAIPAVVGLENGRAAIRDGEALIIDGTRGVVIVNPDLRVLEEYQLRKNQIELEKSKLKRLKTAPSETLDGTLIQLQANIELPGDVPEALELGAEGIGLFRTEFLFLGRGDMPDENEQFEAYKKVIKGMGGRPVTIRTFDLGGDKAVDAYRTQTNPALGRRAIRLSLAEPKMFQIQLRAILRASKFGPVKLLIPMLAHAHEIDQTLAALEQAKSSLRGEKIAFDENIEVGGMIEIPAAALAVGLFMRRLDFLSIGTNDLIQYTLAIDRTDEQVSALYDPLHPAVLMLIAHTIASAEKENVPVSVCGELAGDPELTRLLLGMGLRIFSMHPSQILEVKSRVLKTDLNEVAPAVRKMLRLDEPHKLREALTRLNV